MDRKRLEKSIGELASALDLGDAESRVMPENIAAFLEGALCCVGRDPAEEITIVEGAPDGGVVSVRGVSFWSLCEHDLLPFFGRVHVAYIPRGGKAAGFGSLVRMVRCASRRPQLQERLASDVADALDRALSPEGVHVVVEATQLCVLCGEGEPAARFTTTSSRGSLVDPKTRARVLSQTT